MEKLDLSLTMLGRRLGKTVEYGFCTSDGHEYWCKQYELETIMGRVTRIRLWLFLRDWEKEQGKTEDELTNYEDFKQMLATKNWPAGFDPGYVPYQYT
jgi:Fe-S oxidoreductase